MNKKENNNLNQNNNNKKYMNNKNNKTTISGCDTIEIKLVLFILPPLLMANSCLYSRYVGCWEAQRVFAMEPLSY